jgi:hypothetical protein
MRIKGQCGDWYTRNEIDYVDVAEAKDWRSELAVLVHELIEMEMCHHAGISEADVDFWDKICSASDPGSNRYSPYHKEHMACKEIEKLVCKKLGISWKKHLDNLKRSVRG